MRSIVSVTTTTSDDVEDKDLLILVLDRPLDFSHEATITEVDDAEAKFEVETRAAVAVLNRNVKIQGDYSVKAEESKQGATLMVHSTGG